MGSLGNYQRQLEQFENSYKKGIGHWRVHPLSPLIKKLVRGAKKILDIGSGGGEKTIEIAMLSTNLKVTGIDKSLSAVKTSQKLAKQLKVGDRVLFKKADALHLPFENSEFNGFHDYLCFTHIHAKEWPQYFSEVARVLKKGSKGLIVTFSKEDKDFYGYPVRELKHDWILFKHNHDGIERPHLSINDGFGYHFARAYQLFEAVLPWFEVLQLEFKEHPHPDHKGKRFLWHLLIKKK